MAAGRASHGLLSNPSIGLTGVRCWGVVIGSGDKSDVCVCRPIQNRYDVPRVGTGGELLGPTHVL